MLRGARDAYARGQITECGDMAGGALQAGDRIIQQQYTQEREQKQQQMVIMNDLKMSPRIRY